MVFQKKDLNDLKRAKRLLERPGVTARITKVLGVPTEKGFELLPSNWSYPSHLQNGTQLTVPPAFWRRFVRLVSVATTDGPDECWRRHCRSWLMKPASSPQPIHSDWKTLSQAAIFAG